MSCKKLECFGEFEKCVFCKTDIVDELKLGTIYKYGSIITHYFCLLLSSNMEQNGNDHEGIYGFLQEDIEKEIRRGKRLRCIYCLKTGATLGCVLSRCKAVFHLPCGMKRGSLHQFFKQFKSFCVAHRPRQRICEDVLKQAQSESPTCVICYDAIVVNDDTTMWAPCCKKNAFFHQDCIQKLANSFGGYAFRCPLCNEKQIFTKTMMEFGIYIPERDASWEQEENAFQELLFRHNRCDAKKCICPYGRKYKQTSKWHLILCQMCGSQGIHHTCQTKRSKKWQCDICYTALINGERESNCDGVDTLHVVSSVPGSSQVNRQSLRKSGPDSSVDVLSSVTSDKEIKFKKLKKPVSSTKSYNNNNGSRARRKRNKKRSFLSLTFQRCKLNSASLSSSLNYRQKLRTPQTSSSSVVSVTRSIAPVIILGSDDDNWSDIEVVADVNDVHVNREGNNIQILHTAKEEKGDFVRVQSRLNLKNANLNCGFHMNSSSRKLRTKYLPISTTSVPVNIQTYSRSNGTTELSSNKIYYDSSGFISNSSFDMLTVNSSFLVDPKNVNLVDNMSEISSMLIHSSSNQAVAKSHCGMTTDNAIGVPRSTNSTLQSVHEEAKGRVLNRCRSSTKKYSSWNQSLVCTKSSTKSETRSNNIRLKELSVVLTPITVKIAKNGIVKVVKRNFNRNMNNMSGLIESKSWSNNNNSDCKVLQKCLLNEIMNSKNNVLLKSVYNNINARNKKHDLINSLTQSYKSPNNEIASASVHKKANQFVFTDLKKESGRPLKRKQYHVLKTTENEHTVRCSKKQKWQFGDMKNYLHDKTNLIHNNETNKNVNCFSQEEIVLSEQHSISHNSRKCNVRSSFTSKTNESSLKKMRQYTLFYMFNNKNSKSDKNKKTSQQKSLFFNKINEENDDFKKLHSVKSKGIIKKRKCNSNVMPLSNNRLCKRKSICNSCSGDKHTNYKMGKLCCFFKQRALCISAAASQCSDCSTFVNNNVETPHNFSFCKTVEDFNGEISTKSKISLNVPSFSSILTPVDHILENSVTFCDKYFQNVESCSFNRTSGYNRLSASASVSRSTDLNSEHYNSKSLKMKSKFIDTSHSLMKASKIECKFINNDIYTNNPHELDRLLNINGDKKTDSNVSCKRRVIKPPKKLVQFDFPENMQNEISPVLVSGGKFGFNVTKYLQESNCRTVFSDRKLMNYIHKSGDAYIKSVLGDNLKPSLIEKIIAFFKKSFMSEG
ncbi:uncharacterized protein LOC142327269 isoform X2 [Lycorma delicatula]|uniref:uncharacterized protein LOC142327269 isoform X2 n=1 Tax=Lycorma delicatula TaxID=130591 RepID=UPI003F5149A0